MLASTDVIFLMNFLCCCILYLSTKSPRTSIYLLVMFAVKYLNIFFHPSVPTFDHWRFLLIFSRVKLYTQRVDVFIIKFFPFVHPKLFCFSLFENFFQRFRDRNSSFIFQRNHTTKLWKYINHSQKILDSTAEFCKWLHIHKVSGPDFIAYVDKHFSFPEIFLMGLWSSSASRSVHIIPEIVWVF